MAQSRIQVLETLVEEMLKDQPQAQLVENLMKQVGIPFQEDPIMQMNEVLKALHAIPGGKSEPEASL